MEDERFTRISERGFEALRALVSPMAGVLGGRPIAYNAYFKGTEVVVVGYQYEEDGHTNTKPVAILVDPEVFNALRVDEESGRIDEQGQPIPKKVL